MSSEVPGFIESCVSLQMLRSARGPCCAAGSVAGRGSNALQKEKRLQRASTRPGVPQSSAMDADLHTSLLSTLLHICTLFKIIDST